MPTINFPSGPSLNDTYNLGVRTWKWNGDAWALQPLTGGFTGSQGYTGSVGIGYTGSVGIGYTGSAGYTGSNIALLDATQTLTNKTLTTPDVNTSLKMVSSGQLQFRDNQSYISENGGILLFNGAAGRGVRMYSGGAERVAVSYDGNLELKAGVDIIFEGSTANDFETNLTVTDPTADRTITFPDATGNVALFATAPTSAITDGSNGQVLKTDGSGALSFATIDGSGISWQSVVTASTLTTVAGNGYPINTTSNACTVTLPSSASVGDQIQIVDYAGTFATNNITLTSSLNIEGGTSDKFLTTNREGVIITYVDVTQGWVATSGVNSGDQGIDSTPATITADFLVIAGGGGGGSSGQDSTAGGGGGAGGYRNSYASETSGGGGSSESSLILNVGTTYTITVGAGGAGGAAGSAGTVWNQGATGANSVISGTGITTITSNGGGGGGTYQKNGVSGASGGGGGAFTAQSGGSGTSNQGFAGQNTSSQGQNTGQIAGGGGGSSETGGSDGAGLGGDGLSSSITGSAVTRGAGGGGAGNVSSSGGTGGGGDGKNSSGAGNGTAGTTNTGSGGGGAYTGGSGSHSGGAGGSGVVILRLPTSQYSGTTTGSPTVSTDGTDTILIYNASGSYTA